MLNGSRAHLPLLRAQAPGLRDARLARAIAAPVQADLHLVNDGDLRHAVAALAAWWRGLHDAG